VSVVFVILPVVLLAVFGAVLAYSWAARRGQFDDLDTPPLRMLHDDEVVRPKPAKPPAGDATRNAQGDAEDERRPRPG
jgi:cbb3-type cytochrome oxidase maturation protein